jgi:transcriptional regulator with XRE-family HTH domain
MVGEHAMIDNYKVGKQIALLRRTKGYTGERLAELLSVSAQAVSKWENGKCLPETSLLPTLAQALGTSIDTLLVPQELVILNAIFTDGVTEVDVTRNLNNNINGNKLYVAVNAQFMGVTFDSNRINVLVVKYQTPDGIFFDYKLENQYLSIDLENKTFVNGSPMDIIGAFYGNREDLRDCMVKMKHYDYFQWNEIPVNQESFPSSPKTDQKEYLTLIYTNGKGIHVISCEENDVLCFLPDKTDLYRKDTSEHILQGIEPLEWEMGIDFTWAGAVLRSLNYMGENYTYEQIMGMSGACYRIAFTDVWDWSAVDALVAFDYSSILFKAIGYDQVWADRISKEDRNEERKRIVNDIAGGRPVLAINLRIAPEWGVITGYKENGKVLLCRTYFDREYLNGNKDYLETDFWPFLIMHFGKKTERPSDKEVLMESLKALVESYYAPCNRGYYQGKEAYERWIAGLEDEDAWDIKKVPVDVDRRIGVNDATLLNLIDARRCAAYYLKECGPLLPNHQQEQLLAVVSKYETIAESLASFRKKLKEISDERIHYSDIDAARSSGAKIRQEQVELLRNMLEIETDIVQIVENNLLAR